MWRDEPCQLRTLPLNRIKKTGICDRYRSLVGERAHQFDPLLREQSRLVATNHDCSDQRTLQDDRDSEQCPEADDFLVPRAVLAIGEDVFDLYDVSAQRDPSNGRRRVCRVRMGPRVLQRLRLAPGLGVRVEQLAIAQKELRIITLT